MPRARDSHPAPPGHASLRVFPSPVRGRGASANPANRFDRIELEPDPEAAGEDASGPDTVFLRDSSSSVIARNDSPDVGFSASVNPYRGCEHGCVYCLAPDTPILHADMTWRPIGDVRVGDVLIGFDEYPQPGRTRKLRATAVEGMWWSRKATRRLVTRHGAVTTTPEHRWLQARDFRWSRTSQLSPGRTLRRVPTILDEGVDDDYRAGYVAGMTLGDGTFRCEPGSRSSRSEPAVYWRVALVDREPLERLVEYLGRFGVVAHVRPFNGGVTRGKPLEKVEVRSLPRLEIVHHLVRSEAHTRSWRRGFLAGFFDAEGHNGDSLRISQVDLQVLDRVRRYAGSLGFDFHLERRNGAASTLRLAGRLVDRIGFFSLCSPAIRRKMHGLFGREMNFDPEPVEAIEPGAPADVVDIHTSTGTFIAAGLATHNCYARPTHEYLGFSAGLDFESRIMVKEDAPELLRAELSSRSWTPQPVAISGVTDPYQPVERRLRLTRRCLEVLAEFRNPVLVITKNRRVTRDVDVLRELAAFEAAAVFLSVTTLDTDLARVMEPRTSMPAARLAAIRELAEARVPVGVMVAPVIPGLTDHELPAIVQAAAEAGARYAGTTLLRLPYAVAGLFEAWLAQRFPERKEKVLNRIREIRGGRLNDPRFGSRMQGEGVFAEQIHAMFSLACRRAGIRGRGPELSTAAFRRAERQLTLFD